MIGVIVIALLVLLLALAIIGWARGGVESFKDIEDRWH